jgi:oxygen-independent coproporphyrinogen-3 oxidase
VTDLGVYIHYPWCRKRCPYCDFAIAIEPESQIPHRRYRDAVLAELEARAPSFHGRLVSVYFGGGTPSLWPTEDVAAVLAAVRARFPAEGELEVTLEANPTDCTAGRLAEWAHAGINRLSVGLQSVVATDLVVLGRDHRFGDGIAAVEAAMASDIARVSADVILGTPGRAAAAGGPDPSVLVVAALDPGHLSVYELTFEPRTTLGARVRAGELTPPADDALAALYQGTHNELTGRGYEHYEISSYARPGQRSVHNGLYWRGATYLGLGNGAASFQRTPGGGVRELNHRSVKAYLRSAPGEALAERESLAAPELADELIWLGLRTSDGVESSALEARPALRRWLEGEGLAVSEGDRIRPTLRGFLYADAVAGRVVADPR